MSDSPAPSDEVVREFVRSLIENPTVVQLRSQLASRESEVVGLRAQNGTLRNALCTLHDHLILGDAGVLEADEEWIGKLVESFAALPATGQPTHKAYYDNPVMIDGFPRSHRVDHWTPAEKAISDALQEVEDVGADVLLTDAVILLGDAQRKVAEYVDRQIQAARATDASPTPPQGDKT